MLLYHFPLNTQENIENFTNKGIKNEYSFLNGIGVLPQNGGTVSNVCANPNNHKIKINLSQHEELSICFRFFADSSFIGGAPWRTLFGLNLTDSQDNPTCSLFTTLNSGSISYGGNISLQLDDKWHNVILTIKGTNYTLFYDNVSYNKVIQETPRILCFFGRLGNNNYNIPILTQDIRIYDYALSQAEINEYSRAMVVHYPLNGNVLNGNVLRDCSGLGNDAQINVDYDDLVTTPRYSKAFHNGGVESDGNRDGFFANNNFFTPQKYTISFWLKKDSTINSNYVTGRFVNISGYGYSGDRMYFDNSSKKYFWGIYNEENQWKVISSSALTTSEQTHWQFYTLTYNGTNVVLYRNGNQEGIVSNYSMLSNYLSKYRIGVNYGCSFSDFRIYATALSAADIQDLYNAPIHLDNQHTLQCSEVIENAKYPSKYWRTPTYDEMNYILNTRTNASNLRTLGRVEISSGMYVNGCFLLPDDWVLPAGVTITISMANFTTNSYSLSDFSILINAGAVFFPVTDTRNGITLSGLNGCYYNLSYSPDNDRQGVFYCAINIIDVATARKFFGRGVRLCKNGSQFSVSAITKIDFAPANLQYNCTQHIWRFAEHSYDVIGANNANISDSYNGWIDLFGYGTSGVNYSPTLHSTNNADYASGDISNTDNDWGVNVIESYDYNVASNKLCKTGVVGHNEVSEGSANGLYANKLITNELIEN